MRRLEHCKGPRLSDVSKKMELSVPQLVPIYFVANKYSELFVIHAAI